MFEVAVRKEFTAFHRLIGGHEYLLDISVLETHLAQRVERSGGQSLNHLRAFEGRNPSVELFARVLATDLRPGLVDQPSLDTFKLVLWQPPQAWASFQTSLR